MVLPTVLKYDHNRAFPSDNQHDSDFVFSKSVGLENVDNKNAHLTLLHEFLSPVVKP